VDSVVSLKNPSLISPTVTSLNSSCSSVADGSASVVVSGGTPTYKYQWQGPGGFTSATTSITNIYSGNYTLSVTDTLGCRRDSVLKVITTLTIEANAGLDTVVCPGSSVALSGLNSLGAVNYSWFPIPGTTPVASTPSFVLPSADDGQSYTFQLVTISSTPGCFDRDTVVIKTYSIPYLDAGPSYTIPVFSTVTIGGNPTILGPGTVTWSPPFSLSDINLENPIASNTIAITYTASMMYGMGCIVSDTMEVTLYPEVRINNGFSPNGDGKNDMWLIDYLEQFPDNTVEIYNRWGDQLFYSKGYRTPFDGKYKGHDLPVGTYYYVIRLNHPAYPTPYTGPLTIFR
jgi:gliding motility-associated-like protein